MIGLDTNVLLAWLLAGQPVQLPEAPAYRISFVVLAELVWVLAKTLKHPKAAVCGILDKLMQTSNVVIDRREIVKLALAAYKAGPADFADYLIARDNEAASCRTTLTFDTDAGRHPTFTLLRS